MEASERRTAILKLLCRRRYETIKNLVHEFGVSERTVRRDIEVLSYNEPIYTQAGKYGGGIYITDNYQMDRMYFRNIEKNVLCKLLDCVENRKQCDLTEEEKAIFRKLISDYTKPEPINKNRGKSYESKRTGIIS